MKKTVLIFMFFSIQILYSQWEPSNRGLENKYIITFTTLGNNIFAGTYGGSVFLSTDDGYSWVKKNTGLDNDTIIRLVTSGNNVFTLTNGGIFLSTDIGNTWTLSLKNTGNSFPDIYAIAAIGNNVFAGTSHNFYLSTDNGESWVINNNGLPKYEYVYSLSVIGNKIFAATHDSPSALGNLFYSADTCYNWTKTNIPSTPRGASEFVTSGDNIFAIGFAVGIFLSSDYGKTWKNISGCGWANSLTSSGNNIVAGNEGGVYVSSDFGDNWTLKKNDYVYDGIKAVTVLGEYVFAGTYQNGIWRAKISNLISDVADNTNLNDGLNLKPNPATDFIEISIVGAHCNVPLQPNIQIYNIFGELVAQRPSSMQINDNTNKGWTWASGLLRIDVSGLAPGMYIIRVGDRVCKFVKL